MLNLTGSAMKRQRIESSRSAAESADSPVVSRVSVLQPLHVDYFDAKDQPRKRTDLDDESIHIDIHSIRVASPLPAAVTELLATESNVSTQIDSESDTVWLVSGRRLLIWPNYSASLDASSAADSRSRPKCCSLHLPASDTPYRAQLVQVANRVNTSCCVAISASGLVRFWPNCAFEQQFTEFALDLRGDELVALGRVSHRKAGGTGTNLLVATTLCGNLVLLHVAGSAIQHRVVRDDPGVLRRVLGSFWTMLPAGNAAHSGPVCGPDSLFRVLVAPVRGASHAQYTVTSFSRSHVSRWRVEPEPDGATIAGPNITQQSVLTVGELQRLIATDVRQTTGELLEVDAVQLWDCVASAHDDSVLYLLVSAVESGLRALHVYVARVVFGQEGRVGVQVRAISLGDAPLHTEVDASRLERLTLAVHAGGGARLLAVGVTLRRGGDSVASEIAAVADRLVLARFVDGGGVFELLPSGCTSLALASIRDRLCGLRVRMPPDEPNVVDESGAEDVKERCAVRIELMTRRHALVDVIARLPAELDTEAPEDSCASWQSPRAKDPGSSDCFAQLNQLAAAFHSGGDAHSVDYEAARRCIVQATAGAASRFDSLDAARLSERVTHLAVELRAALRRLPAQLVRNALHTLVADRTALNLAALLANSSDGTATPTADRRSSRFRKPQTPSTNVSASFSIAFGRELRTRLRFVVALRNLLRKCASHDAADTENYADAGVDLRELVRRCERAERELVGLVRFVHFHTDRNLPPTVSVACLLAAADADGVAQCDELFPAVVLAHLDALDAALRRLVRESAETDADDSNDDTPVASCETALDCLVELLGDASPSSPRRRSTASGASQLGVIRAFIEHETLRQRLFETAQKVFFAARACKLKRPAESELAPRRHDTQGTPASFPKLEATFIFLVEHLLVALRLASAEREHQRQPDTAAAGSTVLSHFFVEARRVLLDQIDATLLAPTERERDHDRERDRERFELALRLASQLEDAARCAAHVLMQTDPTAGTHDAPKLVRELRAQLATRSTALADRFEHELMQQLEEKVAAKQLGEAQTFALLASLVRAPPESLPCLAQRAANQRWLHALDRCGSANLNTSGSVVAADDQEPEYERAVLRHMEAFRRLAKFACDESVLLERKRRALALAKLQLAVARRITNRPDAQTQAPSEERDQLDETLTLTTNYELYLESMHDALVAMRDAGVLFCDSEQLHESSDADADADASSDRFLPVFSVRELVRGLAQMARVARDAAELRAAEEMRDADTDISSSELLLAYERASEAAMLRLKSAVDILRLFEKAYRFEARFGFLERDDRARDALADAEEKQEQRVARHAEESRVAIDESWTFIWEQAALNENWTRLAELASASADDSVLQLSADASGAAAPQPYRPERDVVRLQLHRRIVFYKLVEVLVLECPQPDARQLLDTVPTIDALTESSEPLRDLLSQSDLVRLVLHNALDCFLHD